MKLFLTTLTMLLLCVVLIPSGPHPEAKIRTGATETINRHSRAESQGCSQCPTVGEQTIYAPLITLPESTGTEINLNCRSPHTLEVTPTFYTKRGQALPGRAFLMQAAEVKTIDLRAIMSPSIRNRKDLGGMSIRYLGRPLEMWGQLRLLKAKHGSSVDVTFTYLSDRRSTVRNSVWSTSHDGLAIIAIGNPRSTPTRAILQFANGEVSEIDVAAFGTEIIRRRSSQWEGLSADGVTVRAADGSVDLIVAGAVFSAQRGYMSSIRFYDPEFVAQQNLFATNFRFHGVNSHLMLRNTGSTDVVTTPRIRPVTGDADNLIDLPAVTLRSNEIRKVELTPLALATEYNPAFDNVSVEIINTGPKGSVVGALNGEDDVTGMTYDVPLRDSGGTRNSTGAYPWRVDGDFSTIVSITNVSPVPTQFIVQVNHSGGRYILNPQRLPGGATATFDLRKIRNAQIPDRDGNTIPLSIDGGQFRWAVFGPGIGRLIGRAEMLSVSRGISSSYSCGTTCPPTFDSGWIDPDPAEVPDGGSDDVEAFQMNVDSYSNQYGPYSANVVSWGSSNTNVATVSFGTVNAVAPGSTTLTATIEYPLYYYDAFTMDCIEDGSNQTNVNGQAAVNPTISVGTVSVNPTQINPNTSTTLRVVLSASSGVSNTNGTTLSVSVTDSTGGFQLAFSPTSRNVQLNSGQSQEFTFSVSVANAPSSNQSCKLAATVTPAAGIMVIDNNKKTAETLTVTPN